MHRFSSPRRQNRQVPHVRRSQAMPTRWPSSKRDAPATESLDGADDLVPGDDTGRVRREVALGEVQVGAADAAHGDPDEDLARAGSGSARSPNRSGPPSIGPTCSTHHARTALPDPSVSGHPSATGRHAPRDTRMAQTLGWGQLELRLRRVVGATMASEPG